VENTELVHELMCLMSGHRPWDDRATTKWNAAFIFGRAQDEWETRQHNEGVLRAAAGLYLKGVVPRIVIPGYDGNPDGHGGVIPTAYPGWKKWRNELVLLNVHIGHIKQTRGRGSNTKTEGDDFLSLAKEKELTRALVVTQPHQMLRAMLGLIRSMEQLGYWMSVLPVCPSQVSWRAQTYGSQGGKCIPRYSHIGEEWLRIPRYQAQDDLATLEELQAYLYRVLIDIYD